MDIAKILLIAGILVVFFVVIKFALRLGCLFFLIALAALIIYLYATGTFKNVYDSFRPKKSAGLSRGAVIAACRCSRSLFDGFPDFPSLKKTRIPV